MPPRDRLQNRRNRSGRLRRLPVGLVVIGPHEPARRKIPRNTATTARFRKYFESDARQTIRYHASSSSPNQFKLLPQRCKTKWLCGNVEVAGQFAFPDQVPRSRRCSAFAILGGAMNREDSAQDVPLNSSRGDLERALGLKEAVALNMIEMVGIGPFVVIPLVIKAMGGPQCLLAWAAGAMLALLDGFVWSELGAAMPLAGGSSVFLREAYGPGRMGRLMSFLFVWQTLIQAPLSLASGAIGFSQYASYLYPLGKYGEKAVSGALVIVLVALLYRRITSIGKISILLWVGVIGTILWLIWGGATHFNPQLVFTYAPGTWDFSWLFFAGLGSATVNTIYTYWGYYNICHLGGEIREPEKNIPRGIFISIAGIAVLYLVMQTCILGVLPWQQAQDSPFIVSAFVEKLYGPF